MTLLTNAIILFGIFVVLYLGFKWFNAWVMYTDIRDRKILQNSDLKLRKVDFIEFPYLDKDVYDANTRELEALGFRHIGDMEAVALRQVSNFMPILVRGMMKDETISVELYQMKTKGFMGFLAKLLSGLRNPHIVSFEVEGMDGRRFMAIRTPPHLKPYEPPETTVECIPATCPILQSYEAFEKMYREFLRNNPDFVPRRFRSFEDILDSAKRQQAARAAFRREVGMLTRDELLIAGMRPEAIDAHLASFYKYLEKEERRVAKNRDEYVGKVD